MAGLTAAKFGRVEGGHDFLSYDDWGSVAPVNGSIAEGERLLRLGRKGWRC